MEPSSAEDSGGIAWERLTSDTDNPTARSDTAVHGPRSHVSTVEQLRRHPYFWYFVAAGVFLLILLIGVLWTVYHGSAEPKAGSSSKAPRIFYVTAQKDKPDSFSTIEAALLKARPGDRIVVQKDVHEEQLLLPDGRFGNRVTIEGDGPGRVLWRMPKTAKDQKPAFIELFKTEDLHLKGFTLDGDNRVDDLVALFGRCPGLTLEDIYCQGFKRSAVNISHCSGRSDRPVSLLGLRAVTTNKVEAALLFGFRQSIIDPRGNDHVRVVNCMFVGPYEAAIELVGPEQNVEFQGNRFFGAESGFAYRPGKFSQPLQLTIANNTGGSTGVAGSLNSTANTAFTLQFFSNPSCDASGNGEGQFFLGSTTTTTNASGNATISVVFTALVPIGYSVTATATDPSGNTSEFSACRAVTSCAYSISPTSQSVASQVRTATL